MGERERAAERLAGYHLVLGAMPILRKSYKHAVRPLPMQAFKYKVTCPRWALPTEEVPVHVQFDKSITPLLQSVNVVLHESLTFKDFINLTEYERDGETLAIKSIGKSTMSDYDYFGFAVATTSPFDDLKRMVPVKIKFNYIDGTSETYTEHARIFRPLLELDTSPDRIVITDKNKGRLELPIAMKYSGFGQIKVTAECRIETLRKSMGVKNIW